MTTTPPAPLVIPKNFTAHERFLVEKSELAVVKGLQLERWSRDPARTIQTFPLELNRSYALANQAWGYFSDVTISGQTLSALGCLQHVEFGKISAATSDKSDERKMVKQPPSARFHERLKYSTWVTIFSGKSLCASREPPGP